ncbi:NYN domain-containing protein [Pseudoramibacter alactolyticus]|uniref:YacP-like NYN domain-containing protein n=1 Tax=Pseudoramibacter alactolyticus TaxID=113287 RepID=UPI0028E36941|nr:NYN domain-containing protein [Pseudoramibacter alactolyticus]
MNRYLIVDGYNVIYQHAELEKRAVFDLADEREDLIHRLANYSGFKGCETVLVFDAYAREDPKTREEKRSGITVVFTGRDITADAYIERRVVELLGDTPEKRRRSRRLVEVVTSDGAVQQMVLGSGAVRISSRELIRAMGEIGGATPNRGSEAAQHHRLGDQIADGVFTELDALRKSDVTH